MLLGETKTAVQQWEYKTRMLEHPLNSDTYQDRLDVLSQRNNELAESGKEGWELVSVSGFHIGEPERPDGLEYRYIETLYFKRPME